MKTQKIMNESFQRSTCVLLFFQKNPVYHSLFGARSGSVRANDKEKGDNKNYLCLCRTENRIGINEKAFEKEKDILIIRSSKIDRKVEISFDQVFAEVSLKC